MKAEEIARDRASFPGKYGKKTIEMTYRQVGPDRWEESLDGHVVGIVTHLPINARPVREEDPEDRANREYNRSVSAYERRTKDPRFDDTRARMAKIAETLPPEEAEKLDYDHDAFNQAFDALKMADLQRAHNERMAAIKERQHSHNAMERDDADLAVIEATDSFQDELDRIKSGRYED